MPHTTSSSSDSDDDRIAKAKPFGRQRPMRDILGGGKVADVLLWKDKALSAAILIGIGALWYLFEVIGYNFLTLLCHTIIFAMVIIFVWDKVADIFKWPPPRIPQTLSDSSMVREIAAFCRAKLEAFLSIFFNVARGSDFGQFLLVVVTLWILSTVGNYISSLNLLFFGCLCLETLPYLYDQYEEEADYLLARTFRMMKKTYKKLDKEYIRKIPRGPVKVKKQR
ncbi:reticulon-like protein B9 [Rhododendron vialii]|uniref:reticulon-like protein B9 n=1 Tax=Rhododendron vialii TaxID=182163 RepID=UPI00265DB5DD|nr:reticulon-like protein B9 [Rhododendron vialii]